MDFLRSRQGLRSVKRTFVILAQFLIILPLFPGYQGEAHSSWENKGLSGGQIQALSISSKNPNLIFAGSWSGDGLFKSTDGGLNWENCDYFRNREVFSITIGGEDQKTVWVAHSMFLAKSVDEGQSWENSFSAEKEGRFCYSVVVHPQDDNTVYLGCAGLKASDSGGTIFKTTDGGENWKQVYLIADYTIRGIAIRRDKPDEIWAVSGGDFVDNGSIYKSVDGGESFFPVSTGLSKSWFDEIVLTTDDPPVIFVGGGNGVYRSKDGGVSWSQVSISGWPEDSWCRALALDPSDKHKVYAQCYGQFSRSADSGDHWETSELVVNSATVELLSLVIDPQRSGVMYGGEVGLGIIKSENTGVDWISINNGINANHIFRTAVDSRNTNAVAASTLAGLYIRQGDTSWEVLDYDPSYSLAFDPQDGLTLFAGFDSWFGKYNLESGEATYLEFPEHTITALAINSSNSDILYAGTESYTLDRGELYKSTDRGDSWEQVLVKSAPINVIRVDPQDQNILYAGSGLFYAPVIMGNLYKSTDGGENWKRTSLGDMVVNTIAIDPRNSEVLYAGSGAPEDDSAAGIFKSTDRGTTWQWSSKGLPPGQPVVDIEFDPDQSQVLYATTFNRGVFISNNGGDYWTLLGMSGYWTYDLTPSLLNGDATRVPASSSMANRLYTGTASGLYQYNSSGSGMVTGMITDTSTGRGITGAQVSTDIGGIALTDEGAYLLIPAAGRGTVSASAEGYSSGSQTVTIVSGDSVSADIALSSLYAPGTISGTVTDASTGIPVEGATILANPAGYSGKSIAGGSYVLEDVVPSTYTLSTFKDGYGAGRESGVVVSEGEATQVNLSLSSLITGSMEGVVTDALSGEAVEDAEVRLDPGNFLTTTTSEGSYVISDIRTGTYTLYASHEGYLPYLKVNVEVSENESDTLNVELTPCPFSILDLRSREIKKLRRFRDEFLSPNQEGRKWVSLFYQHAPAISRYLFSDQALKKDFLALVKPVLPEIENILAGRRAKLPPHLIRKAATCLARLGQKAEHSFGIAVDLAIDVLHNEGMLKQFGVVVPEGDK